MSLEEIKAAVLRLPPEELKEFIAWFDRFHAEWLERQERGQGPAGEC